MDKLYAVRGEMPKEEFDTVKKSLQDDHTAADERLHDIGFHVLPNRKLPKE